MLLMLRDGDPVLKCRNPTSYDKTRKHRSATDTEAGVISSNDETEEYTLRQFF